MPSRRRPEGKLAADVSAVGEGVLEMSRTGLRVVGAVLLALLLTGCIKLNVDLNVSSSNTVDGTMIFAFSKQLLAITGQSADQLLQSSAPLPTDVPGLSTKPYEDDKFAGEEFTFEGVPLEKFNGTGEEDLRIERQGDVFEVSGVLDLSSAGGASGITGPSGLGDAVNQAFSTADIRISITFPGAVTRSNGEVDGNTVTWRPKLGQRLELQATAKATGGGSSSSTILLIVIAVAAVAVIVVVAFLLARRSKGGGPGTAGAEGMEMAATGSPGSSMEASPPMPPPTPPGVMPPPAPAPGPSGGGMSPPGSSAPGSSEGPSPPARPSEEERPPTGG